MLTAKFRLGDIFEKLPAPYIGDKQDKKKDVSKVKDKEFCVPLVYAKRGDNGIMYWGRKGTFKTYSNVISIIYNGAVAAGLVYAQEEETGVLAEAYLIRIKDKEISFCANLYLRTVIEKEIYHKYSRDNLATWDGKVENEVIELPLTPTGEIDYPYMENYIRELEASRIRELEAFLRVSDLEDYELTEDDKEVLFVTPTTRDYKLSDLFDIVGTKSLDEGHLEFVSEGINFIGRVNENNGIKGYIDRQAFEPNEPYTITATVIGNYKYAKYQQEPYYCSQNINKLIPLFEINEERALYFITHIQKFLSLYDGQQAGYKLDEIKNHTISLPLTPTGEIDFGYMEKFIKAIEKITIKGVVDYKDRFIEETKKVVNQ